MTNLPRPLPIAPSTLLLLLLLFPIGATPAASRPPIQAAEQAPSPVPGAVDGQVDLSALAWLVGAWGTEGTLERWTDGEGDMMLGVHRDVGRRISFEFLRITREADGRLLYHASPGGRFPPTLFTATVLEPHRVVFSNPEHDFPSRIGYELRDGSLRVTIRDESGERSMSWTWSRLD